MPEFDVRATDPEGNESTSRESAGSVEDLVGEIRAKGLQVSEVTGARRRLFEPRGVDLEEFAFFNAELASACKGDAPLPGALRALSRDLSGSTVREAVQAVATDVEGGVDLGDALARRTDVFPAGYVALVSAGIKAGDLAGTLLLFADEARFSARMKQRLSAALAYPLVVLIAGSFFLAFISRHFVPVFAMTYEHLRSPRLLPLPARLFLMLAPVLDWAPLVLLALVVAAVIVVRVFSRSAAGGRAFGALALTLPVVGRLLRSVAVARFCRTLANALSANVPVPEAVTLAGLSSGNAAVRGEAEKLRESVAEGSKMSDGLTEISSIFPSAVVWMLHIGEERGDPVSALRECARLEEERARRLGEFLPVFVAGMVTAVGAAILMFGVLAVFTPLFRLSGGMWL